MMTGTKHNSVKSCDDLSVTHKQVGLLPRHVHVCVLMDWCKVKLWPVLFQVGHGGSGALQVHRFHVLQRSAGWLNICLTKHLSA